MTGGITSFKEMSNGAVIIGCNNATERNILQAELKSNLGNKYIIDIPKLKRQIFKILGLNQDEEILNDEELLSAIIKQNGLSMYKNNENNI